MDGRPLPGTVVAVTGAAQGIGRAIADTLARAGAAVALGDLDSDRVVAVARSIESQTGSRTAGLPVDVTDTASFTQFLDAVESTLGPIDVLINNAGIMWVGPFADEPEATALRQFDVNVHGVLRGMKLVIPRMKARGQGHVINIASAASSLAPPGEATYAATKHAVRGYCTAVRAELRRSGVQLSLVMPAVVDTQLAAGTHTGPTPRLTAGQVADTVLEVVQRPRFESYVPRRVGIVPRLAAVLPQPGRDLLYRLLVPNQLASRTNHALRDAYQRRIQTPNANGRQATTGSPK